MCQPENLAANSDGRVDLCSCGNVHLHVGPVMLKLAPDVLPCVLEVLKVAVDRLGPAQLRRERLDRTGPDRN